jgi:hypothetical protein
MIVKPRNVLKIEESAMARTIITPIQGVARQ